MNLWNMETFKKIGEACGGPMEIALETENQSFFVYAKLKVKGCSNGFIHPLAEIPCESESIHMGLFSIGASPDKERGGGGVEWGHMKGTLAISVGESYLRISKGEAKDVKNRTVVKEGRDEVVTEGRKMSSNDPVITMGEVGILSGGSERHPIVSFPTKETPRGI